MQLISDSRHFRMSRLKNLKWRECHDYIYVARKATRFCELDRSIYTKVPASGFSRLYLKDQCEKPTPTPSTHFSPPPSLFGILPTLLASSPASRWSFTRDPSQARCTAIVKRAGVTGSEIPGKGEDRAAVAAEPTATAGAGGATAPMLDATLRRGTSITKAAANSEATSSAQPSLLQSDLKKEANDSEVSAIKENVPQPSSTASPVMSKGVTTAAIDQNVRDGEKASKVVVQQNPSPDSEARPAKVSASAATSLGKGGVSGADGKVAGKTQEISAPTKKNRGAPESSAAEKVCCIFFMVQPLMC